MKSSPAGEKYLLLFRKATVLFRMPGVQCACAGVGGFSELLKLKKYLQQIQRNVRDELRRQQAGLHELQAGIRTEIKGRSESHSRTLMHDADVAFEDLAQCWRAVASHAALEAIKASELIRELRVQEEIAGGVFILPVVVFVPTTIEDVRTRSHVTCTVVEVQAIICSSKWSKQEEICLHNVFVLLCGGISPLTL